jgi:hypothetical protein
VAPGTPEAGTLEAGTLATGTSSSTFAGSRPESLSSDRAIE